LLGELGDYGGFTQVIPIGWGSSAIDTADPIICPATDQRGVPRPIDGNGDGEALCDIGAFDYIYTRSILFFPLISR